MHINYVRTFVNIGCVFCLMSFLINNTLLSILLSTPKYILAAFSYAPYLCIVILFGIVSGFTHYVGDNNISITSQVLFDIFNVQCTYLRINQDSVHDLHAQMHFIAVCVSAVRQ